MDVAALFQPFHLKSLHLKNRIVMAPMTRSFATRGLITPESATYYQQRAQGEVGLILSEGTVIDRGSSANEPDIPRFYGTLALAGWQRVIDAVHGAGGAMGPQLWHMGLMEDHPSGWLLPTPFEGPSGLDRAGQPKGKQMTDADIADTIAAFGKAALAAKQLGFDCIELHGAHGYLIDQFFWELTNKRTDKYGGRTLAERTRFAVEVVQEVRRQVGEDFAIILRLSQWKPNDYAYQLAKSPTELEAWLAPLGAAGVDLFHCSQRRFWEPQFADSDLNLAGWAKKVSGKPTITVGSVGLTGEFLSGLQGESAEPRSLDELLRRFDRGDFDLVAVGRPLLADPSWARKIRENRTSELKGFTKESLTRLVTD
jgi:2,4-dienoyl-CoA reductase-like NADH-dependent reductase (Old Yellow Enzyme family)